MGVCQNCQKGVLAVLLWRRSGENQGLLRASPRGFYGSSACWVSVFPWSALVQQRLCRVLGLLVRILMGPGSIRRSHSPSPADLAVRASLVRRYPGGRLSPFGSSPHDPGRIFPPGVESRRCPALPRLLLVIAVEAFFERGELFGACRGVESTAASGVDVGVEGCAGFFEVTGGAGEDDVARVVAPALADGLSVLDVEDGLGGFASSQEPVFAVEAAPALGVEAVADMAPVEVARSSFEVSGDAVEGA